MKVTKKLVSKLREEMLTYIYEHIANKELSSWCRVVIVTRTESKWARMVWAPQYRYTRKSWVYFHNKTGYDFVVTSSGSKVKITERDISHGDHSKWRTDSIDVIWHPVHLGVVLGWIEDNLQGGLSVFYDWYNPTEPVITLCMSGTTSTQGKDNLWEHKSLPIDEQSIDCIQYLYNLVKNHEDSVKNP